MVSIREAIIPAGNRNRPGTKLQGGKPSKIVVHETSNFNVGADAEMHRRFTWGGGGQESVSFHYCVDDHEAVQLLPDDEVGWHAGDGTRPGSCGATSIGIETCVNADGDWARTRANLAQLVALLLRKHGLTLGAVAQHNNCSGKNCPLVMRRDGLWAGQLAAIKVAYEALGKPPTPTTGEGATWRILPDGSTEVTINFGGQAKAIDGVALVDVGVSVTGMDDADYHRSLKGGVLEPWVKG